MSERIFLNRNAAHKSLHSSLDRKAFLGFTRRQFLQGLTTAGLLASPCGRALSFPLSSISKEGMAFLGKYWQLVSGYVVVGRATANRN